jgi:polysaccharide pyruvyl transferase WcaK-like protein
MSRTFVTVASWWSTNIGNSFFQIASQYVLGALFPDDRVVPISDQPGFWNVRKGNPPNAFLPLEYVEDVDYLIISGPIFRPEFDRIYLDTLRRVRSKGTKIVIFGAGMMNYEDRWIEQYRRWLRDLEVHTLVSRDSTTYEALHDCVSHAYDGIDVAFFISDAYDPVPMHEGNYVVFNFDKTAEPNIDLLQNAPGSAGNYDVVADWEGERQVAVKQPPVRTYLSALTRAYSFLDAYLPRQYPTSFGDYDIVRTDHRFNPMLQRKVYEAPNSFASDTPYGYLNIYANARAVISCRVHACVATLAFGNPALFVYRTPRAKLLERVGVTDIKNEFCTLSPAYLKEEKQDMKNFIGDALAA